MKQKQYCNKFNKDFKNGSHHKKSFLKNDLKTSSKDFSQLGIQRRNLNETSKRGRRYSQDTNLFLRGRKILNPATQECKNGNSGELRDLLRAIFQASSIAQKAPAASSVLSHALGYKV